MPFSRSIITAGLFTGALLLAACGDDATSTTNGGAPSVDGREFWSTAASVDLVDGTRIQLRFDETGLGASAGCNQLGGDYRIDGDRLIVGDMFMTEMGCEPGLHAQDDLVVRLLTGEPTITLDGDTLTITGADATVTLVDREVADPDLALEGTVWEVSGFFDEVAAWSHAVEVASTLTFTGGTLELSDDCGDTTMPAVADGERLSVTPPDTWPACFAEPPEATRDLRRVLEAGDLTATIEGRQLRLTTASDLGVTATAR
ncbi:MAG: META domain-containing protein [Actinomycetota bacterium]